MSEVTTSTRGCAVGESIKTMLIDKVGASGAYRIAKLLVRGLPRVLVYHRFGAHGCDANVFDAQMEILKDEFNVIPLSSLYRALSKGKEIEPHTVVITIDDGYADFREVAFPILKKYDLPATLYVVSDFVDQKTWLWPDVIGRQHQTSRVFRFAKRRESSVQPDQRRRTAASVERNRRSLSDTEKQGEARVLGRSGAYARR